MAGQEKNKEQQTMKKLITLILVAAMVLTLGAVAVGHPEDIGNNKQ